MPGTSTVVEGLLRLTPVKLKSPNADPGSSRSNQHVVSADTISGGISHKVERKGIYPKHL